MEQEQIIKRLEWLDEERRKDKLTIATLEERLVSLEGGFPAIYQQLRELSGEITRLTQTLGRMDQFDATLAQVRVDFNRSMESIEKLRADHERETDKVRRIELEGLNKAIQEVRKGLDPIPELKKGLQARVQEEYRLGRLIEEVDQRIVETRHSDEDFKRAQRLIEEGRRQDAKRLTDIQGEVAALRKRIDEQRGKTDLTADGLRKFDTRMSELVAAENDRRQAQANFLEKQALIQVERERTWREWQTRFDTIEKQALELDTQTQALDVIHRSVKRSQDALDDIVQRIERRINEITEMQRLSEDRFRQDWITYKADDQKRWTNYTLAQEEQLVDVNRQFDKLNERILFFDDIVQEIQERLVEINEETQKRLQGFLALGHEWMSAYERTFGRSR
jgi:DNA repair exonuclease SbcCD ATPase subunit